MHNHTRAPRIRKHFTAALGIAAAVTILAGPAQALASNGAGAAASTTAAEPASNRMWAIIDGASGGAVRLNNGLVTSEKLGNSLSGRTYRLTFDRDLRNCSYTATPTAANTGEIVSAGTGIAVTQNPSFATNQQLLVRTRDNDGGQFVFNDSSFTVQVDCR